MDDQPMAEGTGLLTCRAREFWTPALTAVVARGHYIRWIRSGDCGHSPVGERR